MARPVQPLGTFGVVSVRRTKRGYVASTRFRELTGPYRRVTASAATAAAAENKLKEKIAAGLPSQTEGDLSAQTKVRTVAEVWLKEIEQRQEYAPQTIEVYRDIFRRIILPGIGELWMGALTVGTLDRFLKAEAERGYSRGRHARVVLVQILDLAVRHWFKCLTRTRKLPSGESPGLMACEGTCSSEVWRHRPSPVQVTPQQRPAADPKCRVNVESIDSSASGKRDPRQTCRSTGGICAPVGIRTPNLLIRSQMLYPLSYRRMPLRRRRTGRG